ncbi:MAG: 1-deoxy-D-xylulose-5-phosphate synthase [Pseudodesulfovibrio sp.]|uniref:1-deoxy-D-xylulose-5-phosphate synthase n=2 Tax=Desulfovibrionaceae TaxID=194924 RepID=E6VRZ5_PSEA9|nr:deoxyxylulose-5-phosphate synthase [Pseudodesulfovibrio aespoeensis Aspo-2]MBU4244664.1 1-deoxy-D-xylulose-5-phosphate synthase [Pseudomonadota bacterium]MBV1764977.1 1-deoxy-D-xylulose-5-phosphate synthase [Pseudodesulfovibrio sp.]MCG2732931.1 1-deoxy-D-xylulose-5-phosphate synthase [Pseudodesulfovibrio aespoeensis]MBU4379453.1 1-deoxy-D-xylulose-5-phosphate synthase [Pseudomonadota bacterium]
MTDVLMNTTILSRISKPGDVKALSMAEMATLAQELRDVIISQVAGHGGHLAPSLGVVELTLALFKAFDLEEDKLIWDVGHQAYAHKLLTGRLDTFHTLRQKGGLSGFPRICENPYDHFGVGHSSTSISAALGMAVARDLKGEDHEVIAVIGDGSLTAGLAFEGLNQAGDLGRKMVVVLNDNEMSISKNVGALSQFLSRKMTTPFLQRLKGDVEGLLGSIPKIGDDLAGYAKRYGDSVKSFFTPGILFEAFHFTYVGPIDGHNTAQMVKVFEEIRQIDKPVLVHVMTKKGKGYEPAETDPTFFHGVGEFVPETGLARKFSGLGLPSYTSIFGSTLCALAERDKTIVAITAAMPEGTGTECFRKNYPERFVDVGICEQHAVTFAAGLATQGYKPAVAIYSTFLQRAYDQIVHDVCLQNLNVNFFLDRGGLVGEDGATHHGVFDFTYLRHIPNIVVMAPKDEAELARMMVTAFAHEGPCAVRYPRGTGVGAKVSRNPAKIPIGTGELMRDGSHAVIITLGSRVYPAVEAAMELEAEGLEVAVFNSRFVKPLPREQILELAARFDTILLVEENALAGGFGSAVLELLAGEDALSGRRVQRIGVPDEFVEHGTQKELRAMIGIDTAGIKRTLLAMCGK